MPDLFKEIVPSILLTKRNVLVASEDEKSYNPYIVNRVLSHYYDCALLANEMNKSHGLDKKLQYQFFLNSCRSWKRPFQKWIKPDLIENLEIIKEYYGYSNEKAKEALKLLSDDQINDIKKQLEKGGLKNDRHRKPSGGTAS